MNISGAGITLTAVKILKGFNIDTQYSLTWTKLSSGNWACTDRGPASDAYYADINFAGTEVTINNIIDLFEENRDSLTGVANQVTLSNFNNDEKIFGEDLDYTGNITANVVSIQQREQGSWRGFNLSVRLVAVSPSFIAGAGALPTFRFTDVGYKADSDYTNKHFSSFGGDVSFARTWFNPDPQADSGTFTGQFIFSVSEMAQLRSYIRQLRGSQMTLTNIHGVAYPFGPKPSVATGYPYVVWVTSFKDLGKISENYYKCEITFAELMQD